MAILRYKIKSAVAEGENLVTAVDFIMEDGTTYCNVLIDHFNPTTVAEIFANIEASDPSAIVSNTASALTAAALSESMNSSTSPVVGEWKIVSQIGVDSGTVVLARYNVTDGPYLEIWSRAGSLVRRDKGFSAVGIFGIDQLSTGEVGLLNSGDAAGDVEVQESNGDWSSVGTAVLPSEDSGFLTSDSYPSGVLARGSSFYTIDISKDTVADVYKTKIVRFTAAGVIDGVWTLPGANIDLAPNPDDCLAVAWTLSPNGSTVYYFAADRPGGAGYKVGGVYPIHVFDLVNGAPLADLTTDATHYVMTGGLCCLPDGTIVVYWWDPAIPGNDPISTYNSAGTLLNTWAGAGVGQVLQVSDGLKADLDSVGYWELTYVTPFGNLIVLLRSATDGSTLHTINPPASIDQSDRSYFVLKASLSLLGGDSCS